MAHLTISFSKWIVLVSTISLGMNAFFFHILSPRSKTRAKQIEPTLVTKKVLAEVPKAFLYQLFEYCKTKWVIAAKEKPVNPVLIAEL